MPHHEPYIQHQQYDTKCHRVVVTMYLYWEDLGLDFQFRGLLS
jgi:hypothetical protein